MSPKKLIIIPPQTEISSVGKDLQLLAEGRDFVAPETVIMLSKDVSNHREEMITAASARPIHELQDGTFELKVIIDFLPTVFLIRRIPTQS